MGEILFPSVLVNVDGYNQSMNLISHDFKVNRTIYLIGEINDFSALNVITQLLYLESKSDDEIKFFINSPGGSVTSGMAIYDVMKSLHCDISTVAIGVAASMGAFLLAAGTKGKRFAAPEAEIMIHQPLGGAQGQATDIFLVAEHIQRIKKRLTVIMADACGKTVKTLMRDMERDNWKTAEEAKRYGLVDFVGFPSQNEEGLL